MKETRNLGIFLVCLSFFFCLALTATAMSPR